MKSAVPRVPGLPYAVPKRHPGFRPATSAALNLENADLQGLDLRGLDFAGANLRGADLRGARTGMGRTWALTVTSLALLVSLAIGIASGVGGRLLEHWLRGAIPAHRFVAGFIAAELLVFLVAAAWSGPGRALRWLLPPIVVLTLAGALIGLSAGANGFIAFSILAGSLALVLLFGLGVLARIVGGTGGNLLFAVVAISGALAGRASGGGFLAAAVAVSAMLVARRALSHPESGPRLVSWCAAITGAGGTSFRGADLRGARFDGARLECADFRGARLDADALAGARVRLSAFDPYTLPDEPHAG